jgi:four helix bundle protein
MTTTVKSNTILDRSFDFALVIIEIYKKMRKENEFVLSKQLLKSGTSIGANVNEATAGQSKKDFIAKMAIASKEARETNYWLRLIQKSEIVSVDVRKGLKESDEILKILTAIVKTAQLSLKK